MNVAKLGKALRSYAEHHDHGEGWTYTRDTGGMKHIRYARDSKGRESWWERVKFTISGIWDLHFDKQVYGRYVKGRYWMSVWATIRARLPMEKNLPDGTLNRGIVIVVWEEDGEYIEWVGPTVGSKIADFLEAEPDHPHAIAIATEMLRVRQLGIDRRKASA